MSNDYCSRLSQDRVLSVFLSGHSLTVLDCIRQCGSSELRRIVNRLKHKGYNITGEKINGNNYKTYRLITEPEQMQLEI